MSASGSGGRQPESSMAYWSDGSAALVVTSAVRRTGLTSSSLYGESRRKFMPNALLNLAGPRAVPAYLTGEMPGDAGWDPLQMGAQRDIMKLRERELIHGRWAMLAAVGVLVPECTAKLSLFGTPGQHWWNTEFHFDAQNGLLPSLTYLGEQIPAEIVWLPILHLPLFLIAELLRTGTYTLERFADLDRVYPGGKLFDPLGIGAEVSDEDLAVLKTIEIQHGRLAMIASFGFIVEALAWGAGPLDFLP
jgi:light-harvesting complex II chlorophyll a/b binding protein 5